MTNIRINTPAEYEAMNELYKRLEIDRDRAARARHHIIVEVINEQRAAIAQAFRDYANKNAACGKCGGRGQYDDGTAPVICEECEGSGLPQSAKQLVTVRRNGRVIDQYEAF